jgi:uncharacterized protein (DUF2141 family)
MNLVYLGLALIMQTGDAIETGTIEVQVNGLRSNDGGVAAAIFHSSAEKAFPTKPDQALGSRYAEAGKEVRFRFEGLPHGEYALSFFHDENGNKKLDTNFIGIPNEGMAASNDAKGKFGPPRFSDAKVKLDGALLQIEVEMKY